MSAIKPRIYVNRSPTTKTFLRRFSSQTSNNHASSDPETTHFGFKTIPKSQKVSMVGSVFTNVADKYDVMNDAMSLGIHRLWKDEFVSILKPTPGSTILDVAGGTGDIAFRMFDSIRTSPLFSPVFSSSKGTHTAPDKVSPTTIQPKPSKIYVCDINPAMIEVGKHRSVEKGYSTSQDPSLEWLVGDAEQLPLPNACVDAYTIAFGIRNCTNVDKVVREAYRVLKRGGRFMCLEFSHIDSLGPLNPVVQAIYDAYSFHVIPQMGEVIAKDKGSYEYLVESIRKFPRQNDFCELIEKEGFQMVSYKNMTFGVVAIHSGFKL